MSREPPGELATILRGLQRSSPRKQPTRWVIVPAMLASDRAATEHDGCYGCGIRQMLNRETSAVYEGQISRAELARGDGFALKLLLTIFRWARPYANLPLATPNSLRIQRAIASRPIGELAREAAGVQSIAQGSSESEALERRAQRTLKVLNEMGLLEILTDQGRARPNFYIPHRVKEVFRVPNGLWQNGWMARLSGPGVLVLLQLLQTQQRMQYTRQEWRRIPSRWRPIIERGKLLVEADPESGISVSERLVREGLYELEIVRLAALIRLRGIGGVPLAISRASRERATGSGVFIALLDPELRGTAAPLPPAVTRDDVIRLISTVPDNNLRTAAVVVQDLARRKRRVGVWRRSKKLKSNEVTAHTREQWSGDFLAWAQRGFEPELATDVDDLPF